MGMKKKLYFECKTGAAGDMLMGALYSLLSEEQKAQFIETMNGISEEITVSAESKNVRGIGGIHMKIDIRGKEEDEHYAEMAVAKEQEEAHTHSHEHGGETHTHSHEHSHGEHTHSHEHSHVQDHEEHMHSHEHNHEHAHNHGAHTHTHSHGHHAHTSCKAILQLISQLELDSMIKDHASGVYQLIAQAEGHVHQVEQLENIHFHEVGSLDALIDVVGCCLAIEMLQVDEIAASPVCVGNGTVRCAHGVLPVPAPATAEIIKGMPVYTSSFDGELLTPTGAAILKHFTQKFTKEMSMEIEGIGYGFGTKEFEQMTCVRAFVGYEVS